MPRDRDRDNVGWNDDRHLLELHAELLSCVEVDERRAVQRQIAEIWRGADIRRATEERLQFLPELWSVVYSGGPGFLSLFSGSRAEPNAKLECVRESYFAWPHESPAALAWIAREAAEARELYHCSHLTTRWRRRKEDAAPLSSLYADLDAGLPETPLIAPSITVESSPGHYQAYFRLTHPVLPSVGEALNRRLAHALGADPSGFDLTQLLRIPGTVNHKYVSRPVVRMVALQDVAYSPDQLDHLLPCLPEIRRSRGDDARPAALPSVGGGPPIPLTRTARALWDGQHVKFSAGGRVDRSGSLVRIARLLYQANLPREVIAAALAERDQSLGWNKYTDRADAAEQYQRIIDLLEGGTANQQEQPLRGAGVLFDADR